MSAIEKIQNEINETRLIVTQLQLKIDYNNALLNHVAVSMDARVPVKKSLNSCNACYYISLLILGCSACCVISVIALSLFSRAFLFLFKQ